MRKPLATLLLGIALLAPASEAPARDWSLQDCINYALQNNISLQKQRIQKLSANEDLLQARAALLPNLSFSTSQNFNYTPNPVSVATDIQEVASINFIITELMV